MKFILDLSFNEINSMSIPWMLAISMIILDKATKGYLPPCMKCDIMVAEQLQKATADTSSSFSVFADVCMYCAVLPAGLFAIEILAQCPGGAWRTLTEWEDIFDQAGLTLKSNTPVGCNMNLMVWKPRPVLG